MTTSPIFPGSHQQDPEGRSVRDVIAYSPQAVNDAWCRKILRKILQSLELQYAMQMPHRAIKPDTIVFHANGEPFLISDDIDAAPAPDAYQADDLTALAGVIHYAITQELAPAGPLHGRVDGYSAGLVAAVDACMDADPARRPHNVDAVRSLLAAESPAESISSAPATATVPAPAVAVAPQAVAMPGPIEAHRVDMGRGRRWAALAGGAAIALALVAFVTMRESGVTNHSAPPLAQSNGGSRPAPPPPATAAPAVTARAADRAAPNVTATNVADAAAPAPTGDVSANLASGASSAGTTMSGGDTDRPQETTPDAPKAMPARAGAVVRTAVHPGAPSGTASYQLQIKPWGNVYVDGVERGVSPPMKRLTLTPGRHTVRITHPHYRDSILEFESAQTTSNGKIIVDFNQEMQ